MPDTRFTLLGKIMVWAVKSTDLELRSVLKKGGWKGIRIKKKTKRSTRKLKAGIHNVVVKGKKRKVKVLKNGQWRWMKNGR